MAKKKTFSPEAIKIGLEKMMDPYKSEVDSYLGTYKAILRNNVINKIEGLKKMVCVEAQFPSETWAEIVYSFIASFEEEKYSKEKLIDALHVLWIGKVATFTKETLEWNTLGVEEEINEETKVFEKMKSFLIDIF